MKILCLDDEPLALKMLQISVEKVKPDAAVKAFTKQKELPEKGGPHKAVFKGYETGAAIEVTPVLSPGFCGA